MKTMEFVKHAKKFILLSAVIIVLAVAIGFVQGGLNLGIDFTGGSLITVNMGGTFEVDPVREALNRAGESGYTVLKTTNDNGEQTYAQLRLHPRASDEEDRVQRETILAEIQAEYPNAAIISVERVGAVASIALIKNAFFSILIAGALILVYVSIRFKFHSALSAILCLLHDVLIMTAMVCILRVEINSPFIAAVLTIVGYSINNTIVLFDRIRDNRKNEPNTDMVEAVNKSTNETFTRSMFTALTTFMTIGCLYVFGVPSIRSFALPIIIGLIAGTYSSLFLAGPIWTWLEGRKGNTEKKGKMAKRVPKRA